MSPPVVTAVILAAGKGTRMKSALHKVLHPIGGRPMIDHLLASLAQVRVDRKVMVVGAERSQVEDAMVGRGIAFAVQEPQLGTGHAVMAARPHFEGANGDILVLYGDTPLISPEVIESMLAARRATGPDGRMPGIVVLGFRPADPASYGRLILGADGALDRIVEFKDANADEAAIGLCNSGVMAFDSDLLPQCLDRLSNDNAKGEYYLTDTVAIARSLGRSAVVVEAAEEDLLGVNSRLDLAVAEAVFQTRMRRRAMTEGATLTAPETVFFSYDTELGRDVMVGPNVVFGPGVRVDDGATIHAFSHLEGAEVGEGASVGPYARLRPAAKIGAGARVGNFVEVKKATLEPGAKANHLSYIGDARVGAGANIGAGTITCNYDGFDKHVTEIGPGAFIGSNTALVAPVKIGSGAVIGAGSAIARDVPDDALALTRAERRVAEGWAAKFRARKKAARKQD